MITNYTAEEWQKILGEGARNVRLRATIEQTLLAERAGIALNAVKNLESGKGATLKTLIRVTRTLDRAEWLLTLCPEPPLFTPQEILKRQERKPRIRARQRTGPKK